MQTNQPEEQKQPEQPKQPRQLASQLARWSEGLQ